MRLREGLTRAEREALKAVDEGKTLEGKHRTALYRLRRLPPPEEAVVAVLDHFRFYERLGYRHAFEALAQAATEAARRRDALLKSIRTTRMGWDEFQPLLQDSIDRALEKRDVVLPTKDGEGELLLKRRGGRQRLDDAD